MFRPYSFGLFTQKLLFSWRQKWSLILTFREMDTFSSTTPIWFPRKQQRQEFLEHRDYETDRYRAYVKEPWQSGSAVCLRCQISNTRNPLKFNAKILGSIEEMAVKMGPKPVSKVWLWWRTTGSEGRGFKSRCQQSFSPAKSPLNISTFLPSL